MLVTTPEKWDVVTRKSVGDVALSQIVKLLILDEVHLLHEDRGPVLESIVARTLRQVRACYKLWSFSGLCASLPRRLPLTYITKRKWHPFMLELLSSPLEIPRLFCHHLYHSYQYTLFSRFSSSLDTILFTL